MGRYALIALCLSGIALVGCSSEPAKLTDAQVKAFKGGPMPPGTWDKIAESRRRFEAKNGKSAAPGAPASGSN